MRAILVMFAIHAPVPPAPTVLSNGMVLGVWELEWEGYPSSTFINFCKDGTCNDRTWNGHWYLSRADELVIYDCKDTWVIPLDVKDWPELKGVTCHKQKVKFFKRKITDGY